MGLASGCRFSVHTQIQVTSTCLHRFVSVEVYCRRMLRTTLSLKCYCHGSHVGPPEQRRQRAVNTGRVEHRNAQISFQRTLHPEVELRFSSSAVPTQKIAAHISQASFSCTIFCSVLVSAAQIVRVALEDFLREYDRASRRTEQRDVDVRLMFCRGWRQQKGSKQGGSQKW